MLKTKWVLRISLFLSLSSLSFAQTRGDWYPVDLSKSRLECTSDPVYGRPTGLGIRLFVDRTEESYHYMAKIPFSSTDQAKEMETLCGSSIGIALITDKTLFVNIKTGQVLPNDRGFKRVDATAPYEAK